MQSSLNHKTQSGSALVAIAALLMLLGVFMGYGIDFFKTKTPQDRVQDTNKKMEIISRAISSYAQKNNRLPCPAVSTTAYNNASYGVMSANSATNCNTLRGSVPVRDLNLPEQFLFDAWGRHFLYAPSSTFAVPSSSVTVHAYCRTNDVWVIGIPASCATKYNLYPDKARFCCPNLTTPNGNDVRITTRNNTTIGRVAHTTDYAGVDTGTTLASLSAGTINGTNIERPAYVLISYGSNGPAGAVNADEIENTNNDMNFVDRYRDITATNGLAYFDDLVLYRTQYQTMAELNSGSCTRPYGNVTLDQACP